MTASIRQQVMEQLIDEMFAADARGARDPMTAAGEKFPGTPLSVLTEAWAVFDDRKTAAWWQQIERTIGGEVIRCALGSPDRGKAT